MKTNKNSIFLPIGTFIDMASLVAGSLIGLLLGTAFPEKEKDEA